MNFTNTQFEKIPIPHLTHTMKLVVSESMTVLILTWLTQNLVITQFFPESKVALTNELVYIQPT